MQGGSLGAIFYNNVDETSPSGYSLGSERGNTPAILLSQEVGQYLLANSLGQFAWIVAVSVQPAPLEQGVDLQYLTKVGMECAAIMAKGGTAFTWTDHGLHRVGLLATMKPLCLMFHNNLTCLQ